ncbi:hypothetical protein LSCM1_02961 [Leishmania martiniquensis]|uniref:Guanine nucleotide-binding protein subunit beta-like protein n=1 Tax=Leishmania martiniquensis TaxID=1580590 RepID=A0A836HJJ8_9TRYP|nr:hypothetical protein LSCM1_02961 [Leishmania martiniquensis]
MHGGIPSAASSTPSLPPPRDAALTRALRAAARLRTILQHVNALRCAQPQSNADHLSLPGDPKAGAPEAASALRQTSSSPPAHLRTAPTAVAEAPPSSSPPCLSDLVCPLAPLAQRVKQKKARDANRQQRRDARRTTALTTTAASATAADMVRNALSQPLGVVASRLLSAAASGAPLLFPDVAITSASATDNRARDGLGSPQSPSAPHPAAASLDPSATPQTPAAQGTRTPPSATVDSAPQPGIPPPAASPNPAHSTPEISYQSSPLHVRRQQSWHRRSQHWRDSADDGPSPLAVLLLTPCSVSVSEGRCHCHHASPSHTERENRHHHHHHCHRQCRSAHEVAGRAPDPARSPTVDATPPQKQVRSSSWHQEEMPATKTSQPVGGVFSSSGPISFLARTLREAGTAALAASPSTGGEEQHIPPANRCHRRRGKLEQSGEGANARVAAPSPSRARWSVSAAFPYSGSSPHAADGRLPDLSRSSRKSSCACSRCSCDSWSGSESSRSASSSRMSCTRGAHSPLSGLFTPLTIPLDGRYDPHAPLLPLTLCYGGTPVREVFCSVLSTSTQHTESRSSTLVSSEWSAESSTGTTAANAAAAPGADLHGLAAPEEAGRTVAYAHRGGEPAEKPQHVGSGHRQHSSHLSSTTNTQLSYVAEMDAIDRGVVAPYVSYLFAPEVRVIDLRQLKGCVRLDDPTPPLEATCIGFSHASDVYLVGTSSGLLWRVPVGGGAEAMRATPLGNLWPPHAPPSAKPAATAALGGTSAAEGCLGAASDTSGGGGSTVLPVPLPGHTAAILSIAFNDDGALFATAGMDGCVIVWNACTSAKLRRISTGWASSSTPSSASTHYAGVDAAVGQRAPHLVRFMPMNNNYLLVSYLGSSELHLYNSSTGLPATNAAGTRLARAAASTMKVHRSGTRGSHGSSGDGAGCAASSGAITALAVDLVASPFFFSGDVSGTVALWTYRAGDVVAMPTLRATAAASSLTALAGSGRHAHTGSSVVDPLLHGRAGSSGDGMGVFSNPLYQLPELRRVTTLALPEQLGGIAALGVSTLHVSQLHSLFRHRGPRQGTESMQSTSEDGPDGVGPTPPHPLEPTAQVFRTLAQQNRACWAAGDALRAVDERAAAKSAARNRRDAHGRSSGGQSHFVAHSAPAVSTAGAPASGDKSILPQVFAGLPSRLSETLSALWRGGSSAPSPAAHSGPAPVPHKEKSAAAAAKVSAAPATAFAKGELLHQLRNDALDVVCPLLVLVTLPCDTIYALGVLLQLQPGSRHSSAADREGVVGAGAPTVSYRLYPLLKTTSPSRLRHLGVGAVQSPDNPRVIIVATPCEEGFVRMEPLSHFATPSPSKQRTSPGGVSATPAPAVGSLQPGSTATAPGECSRRSHSHVLATLPMPYGGRCTGVAWSPNGRFLVAITAEGVIYQWARVYLLDPFPSSTNAAVAAAAAAAATRKSDATRVGGGDNAAPAHSVASIKEEMEARSSTAGAAAATSGRRRSYATERFGAMHGAESATANFTSLLGAPMASAVAPPSGLAVGDNAAARAAFNEENAWRESLHRELERQRRAQAALKLVAHVGADVEDDTVSSSGYSLGDANAANSAVTEDVLEDEETESSR